MSTNKINWTHIFLAIFATTLWGSAFAGAKIGFLYMSPIMLSGLRFTLAGVLLMPMIYFFKIGWREQLKHWRFMLLFGFIQTFMQYGIFFMGLNKVPGSLAAIIIGAGPLFVAVMAHLTLKNDKLNARKVFAILLGLAGVVSISLTGDSIVDSSSQFYVGIALLLLSNMIGSYTNIMVVKKDAGISPVMLTMFANFTGGLMLFVVSLFAESPEALCQSLPLEFFLGLLWLAFIPAAAFSAWYYLLSQPDVKVSELNIWKFIIPVVGVLLSWWLVPGESPSWSAVIGIVIISSAVLVLQLPIITSKFKK